MGPMRRPSDDNGSLDLARDGEMREVEGFKDVFGDRIERMFFSW